MRKRVFGRKLKRTTNQRKALFKSLAQALVLHGRIKTTEAKAKAVKGEVEKLVTRAKKTDVRTLATLKKHIDPVTAERLILIAPLFKDRNGGYTRIIRLGLRKKDNAPIVILEFVEDIMTIPQKKTEKKVKEEKIPKTEVKEKTVAVSSKKASKEVKSKPAKKTVKTTK